MDLNAQRPMNDLQEAVADYVNSGDPLKVVAAHYGIGKMRLSEAVNAAGVNRSRGPSFTPAIRAAAVADFRNGMNLSAVAAKYGTTRHSARTWIDKEFGDSSRDPDELSGGRWVRDGLVSRWQYDSATTQLTNNNQENTNAA